jgi:hypothetical protein
MPQRDRGSIEPYDAGALSASLPNVDTGTIFEVELSASAEGAAPMAVRVDAVVTRHPIIAPA